MQLIKNKILIDLKNTKEEYLLVNLLFGLVDILNREEAIIINKWQGQKSININSEFEKNFYDELLKRKYIMTSKEESYIRQSIIDSQKKSIENLLTISRSASFIFSYSCNFACPYCYENNRDNSKNIMTTDMIDKILSLYSNEINHIGFFGGEPLLLENKHLITYIANKIPNAMYTVITNGYFLEEYIDIFKSLNIGMIQVTLDGDEQHHNKTRKLKNGNNTFSKIINNIKLYIYNKIPIKIRMNITDSNKENCFNLRRTLIEELGSSYLNFEMQPLFNYSYKKQATFYTDMLHNDKTVGIRNVIFNTLPPLSNFIFNNVKFDPSIRFCDSEFQNRFYDCYGNIYSCILSVGEQTKKIGSFYPEFELEKNSLLNYDITKNAICNECNLALICGGGCPYHVMDTNGNITTPNCSNIKNEIENLIPLLYKEKFSVT